MKFEEKNQHLKGTLTGQAHSKSYISAVHNILCRDRIQRVLNTCLQMRESELSSLAMKSLRYLVLKRNATSAFHLQLSHGQDRTLMMDKILNT